jgi:hypothetical protein
MNPLPLSGKLPSRTRGVLLFLFWSLIFGISYTQAALYYSNQTQYFLHGLAQAGVGHLDEDWLATTRDPTPVFSSLVAVTVRFLDEHLFHVYYLLLLGLYFYTLVGLFRHVTDGKSSPLGTLVFMTLVTCLHAGLIRLASARLVGVDYPWYFQAGVAGQYLLGFGLQPSAFGVFLLAALLAYARDRPWQGTAWVGLAGTLHATYLLGGAMLVLANSGLQVRQGRVRAGILQGLLALVLVLPVVIYNFVMFSPSDVETFASAQRILAHVRIPHHAEPGAWFDVIAAAQLTWVLLAIVLVRGSRLAVLMFVTFALSLLLTLVQLMTGSDTLALLFPWRTSSVLVPAASAIVLTRLVQRLDPWLANLSPRQMLLGKITCAAVLAMLVMGGVAIYVFELGYRTNPVEIPMLEYVRTHSQQGEVYLLPVSIPTGTSRAASTNFTAAPRKGGKLIAIDLQRFRTWTGAPIYVDFKSIPYQDVEVLEWHRRLHWAKKRFELSDWDSDEVRREREAAGITHVVVPSNHEVRARGLELLYEDHYYRVYRLSR